MNMFYYLLSGLFIEMKRFVCVLFFCSANNVMWPRVLFCSSVLFCDYSRVVGPVGLPGVGPGFLVSVPCTEA